MICAGLQNNIGAGSSSFQSRQLDEHPDAEVWTLTKYGILQKKRLEESSESRPVRGKGRPAFNLLQLLQQLVVLGSKMDRRSVRSRVLREGLVHDSV